MNFSDYTLICDAFVRLMDPLVEIAIHEIDNNSIIYINGKLSQRKIGDNSFLDKKDLDNINDTVYSKINFDGRLIKSISVRLNNKYLLCINCDVSVFNKMHELTNTLLKVGSQPQSIFANDWQEKLHVTIHSYLQNNNLSFDNLSQNDKKNVIKHLFVLEAFNEKNSHDYVAEILDLGRATVFKYLKEWRNK